jgi:murein DD-endopeptidase MepM/ murein hydrolase activator NlpD
MVALCMIVVALCGCAGSDAFHGKVGATVPIGSGLHLCADYGAIVSCSNRRYNVYSPGGRVIRRHEGMDFAESPGTPVISATHGTVTTHFFGHCGGFVIVETNIVRHNPYSGENSVIYARYVHVEPHEELGYFQEVKPGDVIAYVQDPNDIPGRNQCVGDIAHLHYSMDFSIHDIGKHIDPNLFWVDGPGKVTCYREGMVVPPDKAVAPIRC